MKAATATNLPPLHDEPHRPGKTIIGRPPASRPPAAPEPTLVDARPALTREQLVSVAAIGAGDGAMLGPEQTALICNAYIDTVVELELAEQRAALAETALSRGYIRHTVQQRQISRLEQQLGTQFDALAMRAIEIDLDGDNDNLPTGRFAKQVVDMPLPASGGAR